MKLLDTMHEKAYDPLVKRFESSLYFRHPCFFCLLQRAMAIWLCQLDLAAAIDLIRHKNSKQKQRILERN